MFITHFFLVLRNLFRHKRRSIVAISTIVFGVSALLLANGFIQHIFYNFRDATIKSHFGHLQIVKPGYFEAGKADPYRFLFSDDLAAQLSKNFTLKKNESLIKAVVPRLSFSGLLSHGDATLSFIGEGVDPGEQSYFSNALQIVSGQHLAADAPNRLIMGAGLARNLGVDAGDTVVLMANTATGGINAVEMTVGGLFTTVTKSYDDSALRLPISTA
ncbi:MAG: ABC transporter permease, partial [Cytophagales bacterium]|nr:ABC transporter permease [Cytophagales bacterium]